MNNNIIVSICCITYNHEKYIRQAIESFENQVTNFKYEILIHDDASKDKTAEIITELSQKYDNIRIFIEEENQYSKGIAISPTYLYPEAKGKYIALCEGDDFWVYPQKLQEQVDYLENHENCGLFFHNAIVVDCNNSIIKKSFMPKNLFYNCYLKFESDYNAGEMALLDFAPTASLMFRLKDALNLPKFYFDNNSICGDLSLRLFFSLNDYAHYSNKCMSAYRKGVLNSASQKANENIESKIRILNGHLKILNEFNEYSNYKYDSEIQETKKLKIFCHYFSEGANYVCKSKDNKKFFNRASLKIKFKYYVRVFAPYFFRKMSQKKMINKGHKGYGQ